MTCVKIIFIFLTTLILTKPNFIKTEESYILENLFEEIDKHFQEYPDELKNECFRDLEYVKNHTLTEEWAMNMIDSSGKIPFGVYSGNFNNLGQFDQCLQTKYKTNHDIEKYVIGKYCIAKIPVSDAILDKITNSTELQFALKINSRYANVHNHTLVYNSGICIPNSCSGSDVEKIIQNFTVINLTSIMIMESGCNTAEEKTFTAGDIWAILLINGLIMTVITSTLYEFLSKHDENPHKHRELFMAFSLKKNTIRLLSPNTDSNYIKCLGGIRALTMLWIIICHRYLMSIYFPLMNYLDVVNWLVNSHTSMFITSGPLAVDTFLILSGFLVAYVVFKKIQKKKPFNLRDYLLHRSLRLTPILAFLVLLQATIYKHFGNGPLWNIFSEPIVLVCQYKWWSTLLYMQNFLNPEAMCLGHSWYLAVDMQLYTLAIFLIYPLIKSHKYGSVNLILFIFVSFIVMTVHIIINQWPAATVPMGLESGTKDSEFYIATEMRATVWLFGFGLGYYMVKYSNHTQPLSKIIVAVGWTYTIVVSAILFISMKYLQDPNHKFNHAQDSSYNCLSIVGWGTVIGWVIYACVQGYGGVVNWFLSFHIWEVIGRLSYSMYLVHIPLQFYYISIMRVPPYFSHYLIFYNICGDIMITLAISYLLTMSLEFPIMNIERYIYTNRQRASSNPTSIPELVALNEIPSKSSPEHGAYNITADVHAENCNSSDEIAVVEGENVDDRDSNKL